VRRSKRRNRARATRDFADARICHPCLFALSDGENEAKAVMMFIEGCIMGRQRYA
jgi:hypothetical protein